MLLRNVEHCGAQFGDPAAGGRVLTSATPGATRPVSPSSDSPAGPGSQTSVFLVTKPLRTFGVFFAMALDTFVSMFRPPFAWREYLYQSWFVARVSFLPALLLTIPYSVILTFIFNTLLTQIGAADFSGTGTAIGTVNQIGPIATVLVISGAASTAMCADLGARTIREELDALRVMGINPIQALVVPRVLAVITVAWGLASLAILVGLAISFFFSVYVQHVSAGAFVTGLTTLTGAGDIIVSMVKATLFGLAAGLIASYKGITVSGGPAGVGNAVNETVVYTFMVLFAINVLVTVVGFQFTIS